MRAITIEMRSTGMVLKGGTALLLAYGLSRFSTDLDFDAVRPVNIDSRIEQGARRAGVDLSRIRLRKDTATTRRYRVDYLGAEPGTLTLDISFRRTPDPAEIVTRDGIDVYVLDQLLEQKLAAFERRSAARDLFDVHFLATHYPEVFSPTQLARLAQALNDPDALDDRFHQSFLIDDVLHNRDHVFLILELGEAIETRQRMLSHPLPFGEAKARLEQALIVRHLGEGASVGAAHTGIRYEGRIVGVAYGLALQQTSENRLTAHPLSSFQTPPEIGQMLAITPRQQGLARVEPVEPERGLSH